MKNKAIIISILAIILVVAGAYLLMRDNQTSETSSNQESSQVAPPQAESNASTTSTPGTYVDYSEDALASATGTKVLFFHAPWCPQCRQLDADIKDGGIPDNTTILKVDYDSNQDLRKKYGVTIQTTFVVVDENGNLIKKYTAYERPTLNNVISKLEL